jgi:hypothetical protein
VKRTNTGSSATTEKSNSTLSQTPEHYYTHQRIDPPTQIDPFSFSDSSEENFRSSSREQEMRKVIRVEIIPKTQIRKKTIIEKEEIDMNILF